jgi:FtsP/CotA-like multicopper oxidase with cupredoxin domain
MKTNILNLILSLFLLILAPQSFAKTVHYDLAIAKQNINVTGKEVEWAMAVNGQIPAPTLEFTEGDDAEITVTNQLDKEEVSLHWHGILLPPEEDGVAYVNTPPIFPGQSRTFKFRIRQSGTFWYHSHTMLQEQKGVYGAFVIHPKTETMKADKEAVIVLSDWSDEDGEQILRNLKKDGDYYLYKKKSVRSILGAAQAGQLKTYFGNEWIRMGGMDLSDVGYDAFLINGKKDSQLIVAHPGEKVRLRIINAAASTYFYVALAGLPMKVISADGTDIEPIFTKELLMGMAETYDVLFTVPEHKNFELRATAQDVTGHASAWIGMMSKVPAPDKPVPNLYSQMDHSGHGVHGAHEGHNMPEMDHSKMDHSAMGDMAGMDHSKMEHGKVDIEVPDTVIETLTVDNLKAKEATTLPKDKKVTELKLVLGGDMERYVWHMNGKAIFEDKYVMINEGDVVRFTFVNETMMHHPMHLHGHFFRVLNANGDKSPLKHTVDVPPMGSRTIEFYANEPGQWMLHCHNLYHMHTGMARVVKYMSYQPRPDLAAHAGHDRDSGDPHDHDHWYQTGSLQAATNIFEGKYKLSQTWNEFDLRAESKKDEGWRGEGDLFFRRWQDNYLNFILGGTAVDHDERAVAGVGYLLPMLVRTNMLIDQKGKLRVDLEKRFQWTSSVFTDVEYRWRQNEDLESETSTSLMYGSDWHWSAGLKYTGHSLGAGFQFNF